MTTYQNQIIPKAQWDNWHWQLKNSITSPDQLVSLFPFLNREKIEQTSKNYRFAITPHFLSLIGNNINNPLFKQVLPDIKELDDDFSIDPFNEQNKTPIKNVIRRYKDRIVITTTNLCAAYCRYCTRKWNWSNNFMITNNDVNKIADYLAKHKEIREVIISGGEPFLLPIALLKNLIHTLLNIKSIEVIRIGTRILTYLPQRIDDELLNILSISKPIWIMTHFNHPDEIVDSTKYAIDKLIRTGVVLCNQTVLLKGVNDNYQTLKNLFYTLIKNRIKPYYIFQCDRVKGTKHFHVSMQKGFKLMKILRKNISGLAIPEYVIDTEKRGKILVTKNIIRKKYKSKRVDV